MMVSTQERTEFIAQLSPTVAGQGRVTFILYRSDLEDPVPGGFVGKFPSFFKTPGRYH